MKWSIRLGRWAGIEVYLHATFLVFLALLAVLHWQADHTVQAALGGVAFFVALFLCVLLHEFGHALTARRFGIQTRDITLLPIGGVARLERMPDRPSQELWVALAGPAVNVVLAGLLLAWLLFTEAVAPLGELGIVRGQFAQRLLAANIILVLFNMLPAFPMDGGRVLRALLATRLDYARATRIAAGIGQFMALLFVLWGFVSGQLMLLFIAFFVWIGASQEAGMAQMKSAVGGLPVHRAMLTEFRTLAPQDSLAKAVELILAGSQHDFPVMDADRLVGVLTRERLMVALAERGRAASVADVMDREFDTVEANEMLETALVRTQSGRAATLPVVHQGRLIGLLTAENVGEFVMIQTALKRRAPPVLAKPPRLSRDWGGTA